MDRFSSEFLLHEELVLVWMREDVLGIQTGTSETKLFTLIPYMSSSSILAVPISRGVTGLNYTRLHILSRVRNVMKLHILMPTPHAHSCDALCLASAARK